MTNKVDFDKYTENYNQLLNSNTNFFSASDIYFASYKAKVMKKKTLHDIKSVLEYGCGIGRNIPYLKQAFPNAKIVGSDISSGSLEIARRNNPDTFFVLEDDYIKDRQVYDLIFVAGVFHHIPVALRAGIAASLFSRLKIGGTLFVFEHNPYNPITRRIVNTCPYDEDAILLNPQELSQIISCAGFRLQHKAFCLFIPPWASYILWIEKFLGWLPLGGQYWIQAIKPSDAKTI
jgi:SAM-dependent methyltransferase